MVATGPHYNLIRTPRALNGFLLCEAGRYRDQTMGPRGEGMGEERKKRNYRHILRVVVSAEERATIEASAMRLGMSTSAYLRALGLGYQPLGHLDAEAAQQLVRVNADLSRLGNLLKLWLSDDRKLAVFKPGQAVEYIGRLLPAIHGNQVQMHEILQGLIRRGSPLRSRLTRKGRGAG